MSSPISKDLSYIPPDGGYGWVVVFGASLSVGFAYSFPKALTIYYRELQTVFNISYSQVAWVSSIMCSTTYGGGAVSDEHGERVSPGHCYNGKMISGQLESISAG